MLNPYRVPTHIVTPVITALRLHLTSTSPPPGLLPRARLGWCGLPQFDLIPHQAPTIAARITRAPRRVVAPGIKSICCRGFIKSIIIIAAVPLPYSVVVGAVSVYIFSLLELNLRRLFSSGVRVFKLT